MDSCVQVRDAHSGVGDKPWLLGQAILAFKHPNAFPCLLILMSRWLMVLGHSPSLSGEDFAPAVLSTKKGRSICVLDKQIRSLLFQISLTLGSNRKMDCALI